MWRNFVNGRGGRPTEIDNNVLVRKIEQERERLGYPEHDGDLSLVDRGDFYILSLKFFKFFYDVYGCNKIV